MFKYFKNDKITKLVVKSLKITKEEMKNNDIGFLEAHLKMQTEIQLIYNNNLFSYQDLIKRKKHIVEFNNSINNILISFIFGLLASLIFWFFQYIINPSINIDYNNIFMLLFYIIMFIIVYILIFFTIICSILKTARQISSNDELNTNEYELEIIKEQLKKYEHDYKLHHSTKTNDNTKKKPD